jgi:hypothetical protein
VESVAANVVDGEILTPGATVLEETATATMTVVTDERGETATREEATDSAMTDGAVGVDVTEGLAVDAIGCASRRKTLLRLTSRVRLPPISPASPTSRTARVV